MLEILDSKKNLCGDKRRCHRLPDNDTREDRATLKMFDLLNCRQCKYQVSGQLSGHCFFPTLKKASLEAKWKGKAIACHLLARSWELFPMSTAHLLQHLSDQWCQAGKGLISMYHLGKDCTRSFYNCLTLSRYWYFQYVAIVMILTQLNNKAMISNNLSEQGIVCYLLNPSSKSSSASLCMQQIM